MKRKTHTATLPSFPSMTACASATGIPLALLRQSKRAGCPAFDQASRVHLAPLLQWIFREENSGEGADWHQRFKRAQALGLENKTAKERGDLVSVETIYAEIQKCGSILKRQIFEEINSAPTKLAAAGDDVAANRAVLRDVLWGFFEQFRNATAPRLGAVDAHTAAAVKAILNPTPKNEETP